MAPKFKKDPRGPKPPKPTAPAKGRSVEARLEHLSNQVDTSHRLQFVLIRQNDEILDLLVDAMPLRPEKVAALASRVRKVRRSLLDAIKNNTPVEPVDPGPEPVPEPEPPPVEAPSDTPDTSKETTPVS
jgi:hypothetical protein